MRLVGLPCSPCGAQPPPSRDTNSHASDKLGVFWAEPGQTPLASSQQYGLSLCCLHGVALTVERHLQIKVSLIDLNERVPTALFLTCYNRT